MIPATSRRQFKDFSCEGKRRYGKKESRRIIRSMQKSHKARKPRAYFCDHCKWYHITGGD